MRIGLVSIINDDWGGSEEILYSLAIKFIEEGHEVFISKLKTNTLHPKYENLLDKGCKVIYRVGYVKAGLGKFQRILKKGTIIGYSFLKNPFKDFLKKNLDLIVYNGTGYSGLEHKQLFNYMWKHDMRYINIFHIVGEFYRPYNYADIPFLQSIYENASLNFTSAFETKKMVERFFLIKIPNCIEFINPVNISSFDLVPYPEDIEVLSFACVGLLKILHKGQDLLIETLSSDKWKSRAWKLSIYGDGPDKEYLESLIKFYELSDKVRLMGKVNDIRKIWEFNHLLIMPSVMEGMPLAIVEAMICGRPVVSTNVGGVISWLEDGVNGIFIKGHNLTEFDKSLEWLWMNRDKLESIGNKARNTALKKIGTYSISDMYNDFVSVVK